MTKITENIVALAGGVGGSKLVYGLAQIVEPEHLTVIVNTGDDFEHLGLHIAPDLDTVMYTLAGLNNPTTGWGLKDESWNMMAALARYAGPTWFQLGDRDLATHLLRTTWLRSDYTYNHVTQELCRRLGVRCTVLPMTEKPVRTMVQTESGELGFQEYFVMLKCEPQATGLRYAGAEEAMPSREVISALRQSDVIVFCPSNPLLSLGPILALPTVRRVLAASRSLKIAVSPLIQGQALKGPTAKMMQELGMEVSATGVARHLQEVLTDFVIDHADKAEEQAITELGLRTLVTGTVMTSNETKVQLAREVLAFAGIS